MNIFETVPSFDARTHRQASTYTDTEEPEYDRIRRAWDVEPIPLGEVLAEMVAAVKVEAGRRILAIAPEWMQRNLTARAAELALLYPGTKGVDLPEPERSEYLAGQTAWERIRAIRDASNVIEAALFAAASREGATALDVRAVDIAAGWPD